MTSAPPGLDHRDGVILPLRDMQDVANYLAWMQVPITRALFLHLERERAVAEGRETARQPEPPEARQHL